VESSHGYFDKIDGDDDLIVGGKGSSEAAVATSACFIAVLNCGRRSAFFLR